MAQQIFGNFVEISDENQEYLKIGFSPASMRLKQRWRNNGLSADFLADYLSTFFPGESSDDLSKRNEIKGAVSYIANELLENAMKFNYSPSKAHPVSITMDLHPDHLRFYVVNGVHPNNVEAFQAFIKKLFSKDPNELYLEQLMNSEKADNESGLGFLTMMNDYNAALAWKFENLEDQAVIVTTLVQLPIE